MSVGAGTGVGVDKGVGVGVTAGGGGGAGMGMCRDVGVDKGVGADVGVSWVLPVLSATCSLAVVAYGDGLLLLWSLDFAAQVGGVGGVVMVVL